MKLRLITILMMVLVLCLALASCGDKTITKLEITEGLPREYALGATPDFSAVKATVTYNDDSTVEVTGEELEFSKLDTATPGKKNLTVTYEDFSITIEVLVKGTTVVEAGQEIMGALKPPALVASLGANRERFTTKTGNYVVGDDNPFTFRLELKILDEDDNQVTSVTGYVSSSTVSLVNGTNQTLAGEDLVKIDEENNTFDFTEAAVGKTFVITTRPRDGVEGIEAACTHSLTVDVVDGYNVTDAKELNLMTNANEGMHDLVLGKYNADFYDPEYRQNAFARRFVDQHFGQGYYNTYAPTLKSLVLHCDLAPTVADIPEDYVVTKNGKTGLTNSFSTYHRRLSAATPTFDFYGNYFTIFTDGIPSVNNDPAVTEETASSSDVFCIELNHSEVGTNAQRKAFDYRNYTSTFVNLAMRDHNPNSNVVADNQRHMMGLVGFDVDLIDFYIENVIMEAYTISMVPSNSNTAVTIKDCNFNNAWQNHIFIWAHNWLQSTDEGKQDAEQGTIWDVHERIQINIINSKLTKSGGPVILQMSDGDDPYNLVTGTDVYVDKASEISTYVTGTEAWFQAYAHVGGPYVTMLKALDGVMKNIEGANSKLTTTQEGTGSTEFMNMVCASISGILTYTVVDGNTETALLNSESDLIKAFRPISTYGLGAAPLLQSTANPDSFAIWPCEDPNNPPKLQDLPLDTSSGNLLGYPSDTTPTSNPNIFQGDYIGFYVNAAGATTNANAYNQIAVLLGYYH